MHLGFVDAFGFVVFGGFFVSSVDATTTRTGVALGGSSWFVVGLAATLAAYAFRNSPTDPADAAGP